VLVPSGEVFDGGARSWGAINDGHNYIHEKGEKSHYDFEFESAFCIDGSFNSLIEKIELCVSNNRGDDFAAINDFDPEDLDTILKYIASLVIRSPHYREQAASIMELTPSIKRDNADKKNLIALNLSGKYEILVEALKGTGKFVFFYTDSNDFIFGDGFYQNISLNPISQISYRILVPLTPSIAILYIKPHSYNPEPRLFVKKANNEIVKLVNDMVEIYSKDFLFFVGDQPGTSNWFDDHNHYYADYEEVDDLFASVPGVDRKLC